MQKITKRITNTTAIGCVLVSFAITVLLTSTVILENTAQEHLIGSSNNKAYAQVSSPTSPENMNTITNANTTKSATNVTTTAAGGSSENTTTSNMTMAGGKIIFRETGHLIVRRVLAVSNDSFATESSYTGNGVVIVNGTDIPVTDTLTITSTIATTGQHSGNGQGLLRASDGISVAAYTQQSAASSDQKGNDNGQGMMHFTALGTGKLANLNNANAIVKLQLTPSGDFTLQAREQQKQTS